MAMYCREALLPPEICFLCLEFAGLIYNEEEQEIHRFTIGFYVWKLNSSLPMRWIEGLMEALKRRDVSAVKYILRLRGREGNLRKFNNYGQKYFDKYSYA